MTKPTMRERIARAVDPERWAIIDHMPRSDPARGVLIAAELMRADAVLVELEKPTEAMLDAAHALDDTHDADWRVAVGHHQAWSAMIAEARKP